MTREYNAILVVTGGSRDTIGAVVGRTSSVLAVPIPQSSARRQHGLKRCSRSLLCARPIDCPLLAQPYRSVIDSFPPESACSGNNAVTTRAKPPTASRPALRSRTCLSMSFLVQRSSASALKRNQIMSRAIRSSKRRVANCAPFSWTSSRPAMRKYVASQESSTSVSMRASKPGWSTV